MLPEEEFGWTFPNLAGATNTPARADRILARPLVTTDKRGTGGGGGGRGRSGGGASDNNNNKAVLQLRRVAIVGCGDIAGRSQLQGHGEGSNRPGSPLKRSDHKAVAADFFVY